MTTSLTTPLPPNLPIPGFPNLRIGREINHGYFGRVYYAADPSGAEYAVKIVERTRLSEKQQQNIRNEIEIMRMLVHKNIIRLYGDAHTTRHFVLVMELMRGGDLFERLEQLTNFTEDDARKIIAQVAEAVAHMHSKNVAHRDIKIENLMFVSKTSTEIKLGDFGLAKLLSNPNGQTVTPVGTREYMAPEMLSGSLYTKGVDIWALGCLTYIVLFGGFPFYNDEDDRGHTVRSLKDKIKEGRYDFPAGNEPGANVSELARDLIRRCLVVDSRQRITIQEFLNHRWIRLAQPQPAVLASPAILREVHGVRSMRDIFRLGVNMQRTPDAAESNAATNNPSHAIGEHPIAPRHLMRLGSVSDSGILGRRRREKAKRKVGEEGDSSSSGYTSGTQEDRSSPEGGSAVVPATGLLVPSGVTAGRGAHLAPEQAPVHGASREGPPGPTLVYPGPGVLRPLASSDMLQDDDDPYSKGTPPKRVHVYASHPGAMNGEGGGLDGGNPHFGADHGLAPATTTTTATATATATGAATGGAATTSTAGRQDGGAHMTLDRRL